MKDVNKLSTEAQEIYRMITEDFLTVKQIAIARQTSKAAVYKIRKKLIKAGTLQGGLNKGLKKSRRLESPRSITAGMIRLHGQQWRLGILMGTYLSGRYVRERGRSNIREVDGNTVELNRDSVEVYSATRQDGDSNQGFFGEDVQRATAVSFDYWNRFFVRLEDELGVILVKPRAQNKRLVHQGHYAEVQNELARDYNEHKVKLTVYGTDDGRAWFKIDNSLNLNEAETIHSDSSRGDMERVKAFFNEIRDGQPLQSEVMKLILESQRLSVETHSLIKENAVSMRALIEILRKNKGE